MLSFFHKDGPIKNRLELVSLHIPKTAGTSFRNVLKDVYGNEAVIRLDIDLQYQQLKINEQEFRGRKLSKKVRVAHGHFSPALIKEHLDLQEDIPFITWLRHPVERVLSNFYYLEKRLKEELDEEGKGLNILSKMQRNLMEYAAAEINQDRMHKFLDGMPVEDFFFVGFQDYFSEDLDRIASLLQWPQVEEITHNVTGKPYVVSEEERAAIASFNPRDMALYQKALELRNQGQWSS
jgi:hypothetical protein